MKSPKSAPPTVSNGDRCYYPAITRSLIKLANKPGKNQKYWQAQLTKFGKEEK